jgi:hypothetical protein
MNKYSKQYAIIIQLFGLLMVFVYAGVGALFLFFAGFAQNITGITRYIFGGMLFAYSAFRAYRILKSTKDENEIE